MDPRFPLLSVPPAVDPKESARAVLSLPSWMDPRFMLAANDAQDARVVTLDGTGYGTIPGNGQRWCLIVYGQAAGMPVHISPLTDPQTRPMLVVVNGQDARRLTIWEWGPLVSYPFRCWGSAGTDVVYSEIVSQGRAEDVA